jgi:hypothetical protein
MSTACTVTDLAAYRSRTAGAHSEQELIDDISARAFLYLRDEAEANGIAVPNLIAEHMLGMALVVEAVEGADAAQALLTAISERLGTAR